MGQTGIDWEDAFSNGAYIQNGMSYPMIWKERAAAFRKKTSGSLDIPYGEHPRERYDLFLPDSEPKGLVVFVHGGYWVDFDKSSWSDLASGPLARGWAVVVPSYRLAPDASITKIVEEMGLAINMAALGIKGPLRLVGHSAGGHLVTRMVCTGSPISAEVATRIERVVSISGVHDLRPLLLHSMNAQLQLDANMAVQESPVLHAPLTHVKVTAWVGAQERPEFLRQSALLVEAWGLKGLQTNLVVEASKHHFNVIDGLREPDHPLTETLLGE